MMCIFRPKIQSNEREETSRNLQYDRFWFGRSQSSTSDFIVIDLAFFRIEKALRYVCIYVMWIENEIGKVSILTHCTIAHLKH